MKQSAFPLKSCDALLDCTCVEHGCEAEGKIGLVHNCLGYYLVVLKNGWSLKRDADGDYEIRCPTHKEES